MSRVWLVLAAAACGGSPATPVAPAPPPADALTITPSALGPITTATRANLTTLRQLLRGYEVEPVNTGDDKPTRDVKFDDTSLEFIEYQVYGKDGEKLFVVVPDEHGGVLNVHVTSPKVAVANHAWRVGAKFTGAAALTACECWEKVICYTKGDHVAVGFDRNCKGGTISPHARTRFEGEPIARTIWNPKPFGIDDGRFGGAQYGGGSDEEIDP